MYKWSEPKLCREDLKGAAKLPASGEKVKCQLCNPGTYLKSNSCELCPANQYGDGENGSLRYKMMKYNHSYFHLFHLMVQSVWQFYIN